MAQAWGKLGKGKAGGALPGQRTAEFLDLASQVVHGVFGGSAPLIEWVRVKPRSGEPLLAVRFNARDQDTNIAFRRVATIASNESCVSSPPCGQASVATRRNTASGAWVRGINSTAKCEPSLTRFALFLCVSVVFTCCVHFASWRLGVSFLISVVLGYSRGPDSGFGFWSLACSLVGSQEFVEPAERR
jgi:hypothetical protein